MFLNDLYNTDIGRRLNKFAQEESTFNICYAYWKEQLFERVMRLFVWENTGDIEPKEIEQRLLIQGHCGIMAFKGELTAFFGEPHGPTKYIDEFTDYTVRCPIYSGTFKLGEKVIMISNTSIRNSIMPLIHHYAIMIAHTEVTLINELVNARDAGGVPVAATEKQKQSILEYMGKLFNGQYGVVTDTGSLGVTYAGADRHTSQDIMHIMEIREKLLKSFYSDIGVRSAFEKRNNTVVSEVESDTSLLLLNISDMLKCRQDGAEKVNEKFGTNWSVHVAKEIDYSIENERRQFDTGSVTHIKEEYGNGLQLDTSKN